MSVATESEVVLTVRDPARELAGVRFQGELWKRGRPPEFSRADSESWELRLPRPRAVDRVEYRIELVRTDGSTELVSDPANPLRAPGPFGEKSVLEFPEYEAPAWLEDGEELSPGVTRPFRLPSRLLRTPVRGLLWSSAGAEPGHSLPLLLVHDGLEYAEYSSLLRLLDWAIAADELPAMRAALLAPVRRNEHYSASALYAAALSRELVRSLTRLAPAPNAPHARVGMGASLGALAMLHAHRRHPDLFGGLFLQSGSFFRRRLDGYEASFERFARITRFSAEVDRAPGRPQTIPVSMTCGTGEENLANNRATRDALAAQAYPVTLDEHPDAHNWVSWRDSLAPPLLALLRRLWT